MAMNGTASARTDAVRDADGAELPKEAIVTTPDTDALFEYTFEVTGDLENLEPDEDSGSAIDEVIDLGDRVRVEGGVSTGDDRFAFSGDLIEVDVPPEVQIEVRDRTDETDETEDPDEAEPTVLEDFEDGAWPDDWTRETQGYAITSDALAGSFSVEANGSLGYPDVRKPTVETPRGHTYTVRTVPGSSGAAPTLLTNCQQRDVMDACYAAWLRTGLDELLLQVRSGGSGTSLESVATSQSLSAGAEYVIVLDVGSDWVRARAFTSDGTKLAATDKHTDTTHGGGTPGLYTDGTDSEVGGTLYDQYAQWPLGSV